MIHFFKTVAFTVFVLSLFILSSTSHAMPVNPEPRVFMQPDGSSFEALPHGDEHVLWFETVDTGDVLIYNPLSNGYEYAEVTLESGDFYLRSLGVLFGDIPTFSIPKVMSEDLMNVWDSARHDHDEASASSLAESESAGAVSESTSSEGGAAPQAAPVAGAYIYESLFIMIEFNDFQFVSDEASWSDKIFGGYPGSVTAGSVNDYYQEISQGQLFFTPANEAQGTLNDGFIKVQLNIDHPHYANNASSWTSVLEDALLAASSSIDFSQYDSNQDGTVTNDELTISFIVAGRESSYTGSSTEGFWGHAYVSHAFGSFDGVDVSTGYMGIGERQGPTASPYDSTIGIIAHELGHSAFKLFDLYNQPSSISYWGLMGAGSWGYKSGERLGERPVHMTAYSKLRVILQDGDRGFFQPQDITPNASAQLITTNHPFDVNDYSFFRIPGESETQYWLVEQRKVEGYDEGLLRNGNNTGGLAAGDTGILVTYSEGIKKLWVKRMNGETVATRKTDMLYAGNATTLSPTTLPSSDYPGDDSFSGLIIEQVSAPADQMTAYVSVLPYPCTSWTDTLPNHDAAGRAYSEPATWWWLADTYYANGSFEELGTSTTAQVTVSETANLYYVAGGCPEGDTTAPVITLTGGSDVTVTVGTAWSDPGYSATDNADGDITASVVVSGSVDTATVGDYVLTYNVRDSSGNAATAVTRTVHVEEAGSCQEHASTVASHISAGRAYACGLYNYYGCAVGSDDSLGNRFYTTVVTVKEEPAGYFELGACN